MNWHVPAAILLGCAAIAASVLLTSRWEIAAIGWGYGGRDDMPNTSAIVYRLDRWTGQIDQCEPDGERLATGELGQRCPAHERFVDHVVRRKKMETVHPRPSH